MKCFFKRPPETQKALGSALAAGLADFHQDVHDRSLFYYRLLKYDASVAEHVVNPPKQAVSAFADTQSSEIKDRIFDEFNSLSVIYQKPSYMFTDKEHRGPFEFSDEVGNLAIDAGAINDVVSAHVVEANDKDLLLSTSDKEDGWVSSNNGSAYTAPLYDASSLSSTTLLVRSESGILNSSTSTGSNAMLAIDDLLGLNLNTTPTPVTAPSPAALQLNSRAALDPGSFQQKWRQLPISVSQELYVSPQGVAALTAPHSLIRHMQEHFIQCIASGGQSPNFKFFFFAQQAGQPANFLVECKINTSTAKAQVNIKADDQIISQDFSTLFQSALSKFGMQ